MRDFKVKNQQADTFVNWWGNYFGKLLPSKDLSPQYSEKEINDLVNMLIYLFNILYKGKKENFIKINDKEKTFFDHEYDHYFSKWGDLIQNNYRFLSMGEMLIENLMSNMDQDLIKGPMYSPKYRD